MIRVPRLDKFTLTTEKIGDSSYAGVLEGHDLDVIEKAGWDAQHGVPVESIPAPFPGDPSRQMLRIVLPWPAPAPHAPLYVWLRGEAPGTQDGRCVLNYLSSRPQVYRGEDEFIAEVHAVLSC